MGTAPTHSTNDLAWILCTPPSRDANESVCESTNVA
eukprot:CAMPEP_0119087904 /NCGR_PEP_ID=MMETSP1178-20130426/143577_1 /TAXON_ID=33656 /ORGANISM="unid sp, Strain CCMP2000" /LENGTH=35 /DNA_ID= /DNA_START= /DNA_END= /DNA_ORIENTATION=